MNKSKELEKSTESSAHRPDNPMSLMQTVQAPALSLLKIYLSATNKRRSSPEKSLSDFSDDYPSAFWSMFAIDLIIHIIIAGLIITVFIRGLS